MKKRGMSKIEFSIPVREYEQIKEAATLRGMEVDEFILDLIKEEVDLYKAAIEALDQDFDNLETVDWDAVQKLLDEEYFENGSS